MFMCNRWLAVDREDGKIDRVLYLDLKRSSRLEIEVKHNEQEPESASKEEPAEEPEEEFEVEEDETGKFYILFLYSLEITSYINLYSLLLPI